MSSRLLQWVNFLGDPQLTAEFQRKCGVKRSSVTDNGNGVTGNSFAQKNVVHKVNVAMATQRNAENTGNGLYISNGYLKKRNGADCDGVDEFQINNGNGHSRNGNSHSSQKQSICTDYSIQNKVLYLLFRFGASLGNSTFYTLFFTSSIWSFDSLVLRKTLIVWIVNMYVGQVAKDILKWPRPLSPPVVRLESRYELEYGMPSTHAMVGFTLPFCMLYYMTGRYEFSLPVGLTVAVIWCTLVCFSRIYLGMHSVLDVVAGVLFAAFLMLVTIPFVDPVDRFIISHQMSLPAVVATCLALGLLYPRVEKWSTTRADTMLSLGVFSGICEGLWLSSWLVDLAPAKEILPIALTFPSIKEIGVALLRQVLGVPVIGLFAVVIKLLILHTFSWFLNYNPSDPETKRRLEIPYRYFGFFIASGVGSYLMPAIFRMINIERQGFLSEILNHGA